MSDVTPQTIAGWMHSCLQEQDRLYQRRTAHEIAKMFGDEFTYVNKTGTLPSTAVSWTPSGRSAVTNSCGCGVATTGASESRGTLPAAARHEGQRLPGAANRQRNRHDRIGRRVLSRRPAGD